MLSRGERRGPAPRHGRAWRHAEWDGDHVVVEVEIENAKAGHHLPTGSPLRQVLLMVTATDEQGQALRLQTGPTLPAWAGDVAGLPGGTVKLRRELTV